MKVVNVSNGDYKLIVQKGGEITLDAAYDGATPGVVRITGDLIVEGNTTTVESETLTVRDNIIVVNAGETGSGVTLDTAGITVDRGNLTDASILFNENVSHLNSSGASVAGTFTFVNDTGALVGLQTCSINTNGQNLYLINAPGNGVVTVTGTDQYERNVFDYTNYDLDPPTGPIIIVDPDALPNVQALADYVDSTLAFFTDYAISEADTGIECFNATPGPYNPYRLLLDPTYVGPADSAIVFTVDGVERAQINVNGVNVNNLRILNNTVSNVGLSSDLILTATNNNVKIDAVAKIQYQISDPLAASSYSTLYAKDPGTGIGTPGKSGLYFVNTLTSDELVAKNRALLFSILF
jgi:hypothetical protein